MQAIIEITGKAGVGKTTIATLFSEELAHTSSLFIDADSNQQLTRDLATQATQLTLAELFTKHTEATSTREGIDWAFNDLTVSVGEDNELITVGQLPEALPETDLEKLRYGLNRLIENYQYVIIDGYQPLLHQLLPEDHLRTLMLVTPVEFSTWQPAAEAQRLHTPFLILNFYHQEALPPLMENALLQHQIKLVGKFPEYADREALEQTLPEDFKNCLLRLDIPLNSNS
jgi:cellulose biosynthesis protein BcsQ